MAVVKVHERVLNASVAEIGKLIDSLASANDNLWPHDRWPAMKFDRPLSVGAIGGHGPIRYIIESYEFGHRIQFRFTGPKGFLGSHFFEVEMMGGGKAKLRHVIEMQVVRSAWLTWPLVIRPLHDALMEDALDRAEISTGGQPAERNWSLWVKFLRRLMGRKLSHKRR